MEHYTYNTSEENIDVIYLDEHTYEKLLSHGLDRDFNYEKRLITQFSDLTDGIDVETRERYCKIGGRLSGTVCFNKYEKRIRIECNNETAKIFADCVNATNLSLIFSYAKDGCLPSFYCSTHTNRSNCNPGCKQFINSNKILLTQKYQNNIVPAWQPICNCEIPKTILELDPTVRICDVE